MSDALLRLVCSTTNPPLTEHYRSSEKGREELDVDLAETFPKTSRDETKNACVRATALRDDITIQKALLESAPNEFKILARAADYYPFSLEDSAVLRCTTCSQA